uniref:Ionotropic glutamate receptor L-glutamate and glycine-binding domain-containing protein n=1 Tax=Anopheles culicifacies TaxID=139723 RepID=A0A182MHF6_9DIPT
MSEIPYQPYVSFAIAYPPSLPLTPVRINIPSLVIKFSADKVNANHENSYNLLYIFEYLHVKGTEKNIIVLIEGDDFMEASSLVPLVRIFTSYGALDVLYVIVHPAAFTILRFDNAITYYVQLSSNSPLDGLFPERFLDLRGRPYLVAWYDNEPMTFRRNNDVVGVDVDFINIIANHQNTYVEYTTGVSANSQRTIDFATYRLGDTGYWSQKSTPLYFPNPFRWCLAVPRSYQRIVSGQIIRPFSLHLWILLLVLATVYLGYKSLLIQLLRRQYPAVFQIINAPIKLLVLLLHFMVLESYIAMLTKQLELLHVPSFPKTLEEFSESSIPLLLPVPNLFDYLKHNPNHADQLINWNRSAKYDPARLGILQMCDLFESTIEDTTALIGKRLDKHQFYLITQPVLTTSMVSPFRKDSPLVHTFQRYVNRLNEAGVWMHLVSKWTYRPRAPKHISPVENPHDAETLFLELMHVVPIYIIAAQLLVLSLIVFIMEHIVFKIISRRERFI